MSPHIAAFRQRKPDFVRSLVVASLGRGRIAVVDGGGTAIKWGGVRSPSTNCGFEGFLWLMPHG